MSTQISTNLVPLSSAILCFKGKVNPFEEALKNDRKKRCFDKLIETVAMSTFENICEKNYAAFDGVTGANDCQSASIICSKYSLSR